MEEAPTVNKLQSEIRQLKLSIVDAKEANGDLEHVLHMISDGMMMISKEGRITYVNKALEQIVGYKSQNIIGSHFSDPRWNFKCIDAASVPDDSVFQSVFRTGQELTDKVCKMEFEQGNQGLFIINASIHHDGQGNMAGIAAIIRDCTELNRVKAENQEIKTVYERLAQYADEAIFRIHAESGRVIYINDAAEKILGYSLADYRSDASVQMKVINEHHLRTWNAAIEDKSDAKNVLRNIIIACTASDGQTVIMEFTVIAVRNDGADIVYFECIGRDITVRRFMEAELAKAQKLESIGLLAGGIAHDFNNIMTAVFGSLALAKMESVPESPAYKRLVSAEEHCMKAKALTRKLLTYSRGGSPQRKTASIANVIHDAVNFSLSGKNIDCRFEFPDDLWSAQIDEGQMHQVVHSLVSNAAEAMPQGGVIAIGAQNIDLTADQITPLKAGSYIKWFVRDCGVGISREHMKKIFDPYFTTKEMGSVKGMGLGLAICYSIVKSHEGMIMVESTPGAGTVFTVYIPAANDEKNEQKPVAVKGPSVTPKPNVLLIDDEQILLDVTGSMLKHIGYDVMTAKSHGDAMEYYRRARENGNPFSLIIMDLTMRGDEGGEIAIRRWKDAYPEVKAVISSGYMNDPVIEEYWKYGFVGAMVKPYSLVELKSSLEKILAGKSNEIN
jgi:two-component system, cell cycle sensor histidine kinase and response regulator CckA